MLQIEMKFCRRCECSKPVEHFGICKRTPSGRRSMCKECYNTWRRRWRDENVEHVRKQKMANYYAKHDENKARLRKRSHKVWAWKLRTKYKMTPEDFWALVKKQDGKCVICQQLPKPGHSLHIDHDHVTGEVRGLLCVGCNGGIGILGDSVANLERAANYLRPFEEKRRNAGIVVDG